MNWFHRRARNLDCYSGMYTARPKQICRPESVDKLKEILAGAVSSGQKVTFRAGAHAFDSQALGDEFVVLMNGMNSIEVDKPGGTVRVGPGARWGDIVAKLQPDGLVPAGTVTSSVATAGGTLAADCLSRFSPRYGKEATWVESFSLVTLDGKTLVCKRPAGGTSPSSWSDGEQMFMAAIGGFGYLGAIISITYRLLRFPQPISSIETTVKKYATFDDIAAALVPATKTALAAAASGSPPSPSEPDAVYAGLYVGGRDGESWTLFTSKFSSKTKLRRCVLYWPQSNPIRILGEWLMRVRLFRRWIDQIFLWMTKDGETYTDDLHDFLFFMDANARARKIAGWFGLNLRTIQQTFVVPVDFNSADSDEPQKTLVKWLNEAHALFGARGLEPTLQDVLYLPEDMAFNLSPSSSAAGFAVSYAFETSNKKQLDAAEQAFSDLADILCNDFKGRVSLVKNVYVSQDTLAKMYGAGATHFFALKAKYDPQGLLRNDFLDRTFGDMMDNPDGAAGGS